MQLFAARVTLGLAMAFGVCAQEQPAPGKDARPAETQGLPPRVAPADYQAQVQTGTVTLAADFARHSVPTEQGTYSTEEFVIVELGLFGPAGTRVQLSLDDFSLRINGKKNSVPAQPYGLLLPSLKDPEWLPPDPPPTKSKGGITGGGGGQGESNAPPPVVHMPLELVRVMNQHTQKAALALGDRLLPQAGLIFFPYRGNPRSITSVDLIYSGSAGKATLALRP